LRLVSTGVARRSPRIVAYTEAIHFHAPCTVPSTQTFKPLFWTRCILVPIAARVERDGLMAAASARIAMTAQCRGAAADDGIEHLAMHPSKVRLVLVPKAVARWHKVRIRPNLCKNLE
jgi:hypothetical protein